MRGFVVALVLYTVSGVAAAALAVAEDGADAGIVAGGIVWAVLVAVVLGFFAQRRHRWPKWTLLVLLIGGIAAVVSYLDARSLFALFDVVALVVLLRSWTDLAQ